jgi:hypothetical protein
MKNKRMFFEEDLDPFRKWIQKIIVSLAEVLLLQSNTKQRRFDQILLQK